MPHQVLDIEASCIENDTESSYSSQIEEDDGEIADFIDNADISTNPSFYHRLENDQRNSDKYSFLRHARSHGMHEKKFEHPSISSSRTFISESSDDVHRCIPSYGCNHENHQMHHKAPRPREPVPLASLSLQEIIYRYHFRTCSEKTREQIRKYVHSHYSTFVPSFLAYLHDATRKFLSKMGNCGSAVGFDGRCDTDKEKDNASTIESFDIDKATSSPTIEKDKLCKNRSVDDIHSTLCMLVATSQAHKVHAIAGSIAKHIPLRLELWKKHPEMLDKIIEKVYQDLMKRTGVRKRTRRGGKRRRLVRQEFNNSEKAEKPRSQRRNRRQRRQTNRSRRFSIGKGPYSFHHLH